MVCLWKKLIDTFVRIAAFMNLPVCDDLHLKLYLTGNACVCVYVSVYVCVSVHTCIYVHLYTL